jgi:aminoglycoside phosphotransferase (APT) family kinase protein
MYSRSKTPVTHDQAQAIARQAFGSCASLVNFSELTDGYFNAAYLLELAQAPKCVLKVAPPEDVLVMRYEKDIMLAEVETIQLVRQNTQVPAPEIFVHDRSRQTIGSDYFLMSFLPGVPLNKVRKDLTAEQNAAIDRQAGIYLRQMNTIRSARFGGLSHPARQFDSWRSAYDALLRDVLQDGQDLHIRLPLPNDEIYLLLGRHYVALDEVTAPSLVHWDLWDGNIFLDLQTGSITGIIDFERALWGDPLMEANFVFWQNSSAFLEGYGIPMLDTPARQTCRLLYNVYLWLIMVIECYYRAYENDHQEKWAREQLARDLNLLK